MTDRTKGIRLQKLLADSGMCSRRSAETLIQSGRVTVNGTTVTTLGTRALPTDRIRVDDRALPTRRDPIHVMLHKPAGVVTTTLDPEGRPTVVQMLPRRLSRLFPVGRLDLQSTGLVLLTNDGDLAAILTHPRYHVPRRYRVKVSGAPDERALARLRRGIRLDDGPTGPIEVTVAERRPTKTWLEMTVHEGRNHLIRRVCAAIGHSVEKLQRTALGPLELGKLGVGEFRSLTDREIAALRRTAHAARRGAASAAAPTRTAPRRAPRPRNLRRA
jgi:23S rRNA pseudouridine2605 synthase